MSVTSPEVQGRRRRLSLKSQQRLEGIRLLAVIVAVMWIVEIINTIDSNRLDRDGIYARSVSHLWGILTAPFIHAGFGHLIGNTIPFVFLGLIIALRGAARLALVTAIVIVLGGLGTWLISPAGVSTVGASGLVFGACWRSWWGWSSGWSGAPCCWPASCPTTASPGRDT
jgi:membrane associated rhomboid family serine protease